MKTYTHPVRRLLCLLIIFSLVFSTVPALGEGGISAWTNTDLEGAVQLLTKARLKDDFHMAVNRQWLLFEPIPWGASQASSFMDQTGVVMERKAALMQNDSLTGHDAELMRKLYDLVLDWDSRNALGGDAILSYVEAVSSVQTLEELTDYMISDENVFMLDPSYYGVTPDLAHPDVYVAVLYPLPLMMGDSAQYAQRTAYGELLYGVNRDSTLLVLNKLGYTPEEAQAVFDRAFAFDALIAPHIKPNDAHYEADYLESCLNYYTREELDALCGAYPMTAILDLTATGSSKRFLVTEPEHYRALGEIYTEENIPLIRDWIVYYMVNYLGRFLDRDTYLALDAIESQAVGIEGEAGDLDIAMEALESFLPVPMDNLYIQAYCTEEMRRDVLNIIDEVTAHYRVMLENEDWLSPETREKAVEKLDALRVHAVYPDALGDWSHLDIRGKEEGGTLMEAVVKLSAFAAKEGCDKVNQPVDHDEWDQASSPTSEVNAFYSQTDNSITILAGILGGVFYGPDMTYEEKLGGIGMVIAHEISHAFDNDGAKYDKDGHLNNWWAEKDYAAFLERAEKLTAYYDQFVPYEGGTYSGVRIQSEAIADMGSMKCMLAIAREQENFDYNAYFRQFARVWRTKMLPNAMILTVATDSHPLGCLRTNVTVQQFEEFYETFDVQPGDQMYLAPEERIAVW